MFPQLFDTVPDALVVVEGSGRIEMANRQAEQLFGYPEGGLVGLPIENLMPSSVRERHHSHRSAYMSSPRTRPMGGSGMALVGQRRDGAQFPVEIALSPLETDQGLRYLASIRDISETQRARQALIRARYDALVARIGQQALESADENLVVAGLPLLLADALGIEAVALAFLREHGDLDLRAAAGFDPSLLDSHELQEIEVAIAHGAAKVIEGEDASREGYALPLLAGTGGSAAVVPLVDRARPQGALIAWSKEPRRFDHDALHLLQSTANLLAALMQRRRTEEQLAHSQRLDAIGQLTGGIAHDFNNLLTVMSGSLQLLEMECGQQPEASELIASALRSVGRGAELTGKLLAFARRQRLSPSALMPATLLRDLELMLRRTLGDTIRLKVEWPDDIPAVYADASQLDSALLNLALNARDAMPRGGDITLAVEERWVTADAARAKAKPGHYIVFSVTDTGMGMTPETLARAVEPFYTTKGMGRGSGLGLSMVYGFVEQSGGYFHVNSRLGYGTRVELALPAALTARDEPTPPSTGLSSGQGERVLVVEDEPEVRSIASAFIRSLGYRVEAVADAAAALQRLAGEPSIDVLFSDVMLGAGMNGKELALAARRQRPQLAILLTSGYEAVEASDKSEDIELLRKPYQREQLAAALQRCLVSRLV
ncbi:PAS domain S-box protein [Agrilutibacter solisilvae]|uniref:histidine kinase n=1 Tax=Agrilutibacter solisilvae TaxID=2763317 RepID=A0A974XXM0_9GAMM|nr:PAS domain S-box protein [Lysobacter solisilvae]QSX77672.1 PAS domain S-box protein [Lysobacter solisilvae]